MAENRELQKKILTYRFLEARLEAVLKQREMLASKLIEMQITTQSIDELGKGEEMLFPIGSGAYSFGKVAEKGKIIVEIGGSVALEKTMEEGKKILEERMKEIEKSLNATQGNIAELSSNMNRLGAEIQELGKGMEGTPEAG